MKTETQNHKMRKKNSQFEAFTKSRVLVAHKRKNTQCSHKKLKE